MSITLARTETTGSNRAHALQPLASLITWEASKQTYFTIRLLVDRALVTDAYRAYAYFRWVDDQLDEGGMNATERMAFVEQQSELIERLYRGEKFPHLRPEEHLLADLIRGDRDPDSGLQSYIYHMMAVMAFDAERRGRLVTQAELNLYTRWLATAVTEALHYFIGRRCGSPQNEMRYLAATGAHITHMLRDTWEDIKNGYINIPVEVIETTGIGPGDVHDPAYRAWVMHRVELARGCFRTGRRYLEGVKNCRCRLAGYAYIARFETVLDAIEHNGYRLQADYPEYKTLRSGLKMGWTTLFQAARQRQAATPARRVSVAEG